MKYYTDGIHLYEIADQRTVQNYGLTEGVFRDVIITPSRVTRSAMRR